MPRKKKEEKPPEVPDDAQVQVVDLTSHNPALEYKKMKNERKGRTPGTKVEFSPDGIPVKQLMVMKNLIDGQTQEMAVRNAGYQVATANTAEHMAGAIRKNLHDRLQAAAEAQGLTAEYLIGVLLENTKAVKHERIGKDVFKAVPDTHERTVAADVALDALGMKAAKQVDVNNKFSFDLWVNKQHGIEFGGEEDAIDV